MNTTASAVVNNVDRIASSSPPSLPVSITGEDRRREDYPFPFPPLGESSCGASPSPSPGSTGNPYFSEIQRPRSTCWHRLLQNGASGALSKSMRLPQFRQGAVAITELLSTDPGFGLPFRHRRFDRVGSLHPIAISLACSATIQSLEDFLLGEGVLPFEDFDEDLSSLGFGLSAAAAFLYDSLR